MSEPSVYCVMLTRDRRDMARKAVEYFIAQTYARKRLVVLESVTSSASGYYFAHARPNSKHIGWGDADSGADVVIHSASSLGLKDNLTIGQLRQVVNLGAQRLGADIIAHWDDDDYSHPNRIAEQVALLQSSGADAVGYSEMLFWDMRPGAFAGAWLYRHPDPNYYCLGTSLCYWRKTWEHKPFEATSRGEDRRFITGLKTAAVTANPWGPTDSFGAPAMIARIHGGNTCSRIEAGSEEWKRVPEWDDYCRQVMTL